MQSLVLFIGLDYLTDYPRVLGSSKILSMNSPLANMDRIKAICGYILLCNNYYLNKGEA